MPQLHKQRNTYHNIMQTVEIIWIVKTNFVYYRVHYIFVLYGIIQNMYRNIFSKITKMAQSD